MSYLDGLRGVAALWVLLSHVQILTGLRKIPLLSSGDLAVDLFMMLSGFLMTHHYIARRFQEPWEAPSTAVTFWLRRFFRIAPLYYLLLLAAIALGPWMGEFRNAIAAHWPHTATSSQRYYDQGLANIIMHVSFLFGFLPAYGFRTPLPDWSIGLEMQFYLIFPLLMLCMQRWGAFRFGLGVALLCMVLRLVVPGHFTQWQMPAFIPMKLAIFLIGMWMAVGRHSRRYLSAFTISMLVAILLMCAERSLSSIFRVGITVTLFYLLTDGTLPSYAVLDKIIERIRSCFSGKLARFAGDSSYSVYLLHLLVLIPLAGTFSQFDAYLKLPAPIRFFLCAVMLICLVYPTAWMLHRVVETPGIRLGKMITGLIAAKEVSAQVSR